MQQELSKLQMKVTQGSQLALSAEPASQGEWAQPLLVELLAVELLAVELEVDVELLLEAEVVELLEADDVELLLVELLLDDPPPAPPTGPVWKLVALPPVALLTVAPPTP